MIGLAQFVPLFLLTPIVGLVADSDRPALDRARHDDAAAADRGDARAADLGGSAVAARAVRRARCSFGIARAFAGPAYSALAPNLVPRESLPTAIAVSSIAWQVGIDRRARASAGFLYAIHPDVAYATSTGAVRASRWRSIFLIGPVPQPPAQTRSPPARSASSTGFAYVRHNRLVLATITLDLFAVLLAGATALLPVFARDILHVGAQGLASSPRAWASARR